MDQLLILATDIEQGFLDYVLKFDDIWICKREDIANHWIKNYS